MGWVHPHRLLQKAGSSPRLGLAHCFAQNLELMLPFGAHFCFCAGVLACCLRDGVLERTLRVSSFFLKCKSERRL